MKQMRAQGKWLVIGGMVCWAACAVHAAGGDGGLSDAFGQAQGMINDARGQGVNVSAAQSALNQAKQQYSKYLSMQQGMSFRPPQLETINPFGDYLFHGVAIKPVDGKLVTRSWDDWGKNEFGPMHGLPNFSPSGGTPGSGNGSPSVGGPGVTGIDGKPFVPAAPPPPPGAMPNGQNHASATVNDPNVVDLTGSRTLTPQLLRSAEDNGKPVDPQTLPSGTAFFGTRANPSSAELREIFAPGYVDPYANDPKAIGIFQFPESAGKPNSEKRVLVLGVGSTMEKTFVDAVQQYKGKYDIIIGTDMEDSYWNAYRANTDQNVAQLKYSEPILKELRRIAGPRGGGELDFAEIDLHSKGVLAFSSLLAQGAVSADKVIAVGPAVGKDLWAIKDLATYNEGRKAGSVVVGVGDADLITKLTPLSLSDVFINPGNAVDTLGTHLTTEWFSDEKVPILGNYGMKPDSRLKVLSVDTVNYGYNPLGWLDPHYLDNYQPFLNQQQNAK